MIEAQIGAPLGFINPLLYSLAGSSVFTDINDGANNQWSGEPKPAPFYTCRPGWDACTGWGNLNGGQLLPAIKEDLAQQEKATLPGLRQLDTQSRADTRQPGAEVHQRRVRSGASAERVVWHRWLSDRGSGD